MGAAAAAGVGGAIANVYGAYQDSQTANDQARQILNESDRAVAQKKEDVKSFMADQESAYAKSGVILDGSPLLVLEKTRQKGLEEVENIRESARAQANSLSNAGKNRVFGSLLSLGGQAGGAAFGNGAPSSPAASGPSGPAYDTGYGYSGRGSSVRMGNF